MVTPGRGEQHLNNVLFPSVPHRPVSAGITSCAASLRSNCAVFRNQPPAYDSGQRVITALLFLCTAAGVKVQPGLRTRCWTRQHKSNKHSRHSLSYPFPQSPKATSNGCHRLECSARFVELITPSTHRSNMSSSPILAMLATATRRYGLK
jgi:hypothetical protein